MTRPNGGANVYRGETLLTLGGRTYALRLSMNVCARLEDALEARGDLPQTLLNAGFRTVRATFHTVLTSPSRSGGAPSLPTATTLEAVGDLLDEAGGLGAESEVAHAYWGLVVNAGFLDREEAERLKLLPPGKAEAGVGDAPEPAKVDATAPPAGT